MSCSHVRENDSDDEAVQTQSLTENEDQDNSHEDIFLCSRSHTGVTGHTDSEASSQRGEAAAQAGGEVLVASVGAVRPRASGDFGLRGYVN